MSSKGRINGINPAGLSTPLNICDKGPADLLHALTAMALEALQLAKSNAVGMQELRADMIKNNAELKTFMNAVMGALQVEVAPAPAAPLSPAPTVPFSFDLAALPAPEQTSPFTPDGCNASERRHRCEQCGNTYTRKYSLKAHMLFVHSKERPYPCDACEMKFAQKNDLTRHMRKHTGEKPYKCVECGIKFAVKSTLTTHMRKHTGEKPYRCAECGDAFTQKGGLTIHMRTQHAGEKP